MPTGKRKSGSGLHFVITVGKVLALLVVGILSMIADILFGRDTDSH